MKFETRLTWDAPLSRVMAMLTDRRYFERKLELMAHEEAQVLSAGMDGTCFTVVTRVKGKPSVKLPALAQKFLKPDQAVEIEQTDCWDTATATGSVNFVNRSVSVISISATMQLSEQDGCTTNQLSWTVECSIPLVGGKLAEVIADDIRTKAARNEEVSRQILAESF